MKTRSACGLLVWLLVAACERPDSALFSSDLGAPGGSVGSAGNSAGSGASVGGSAAGGSAALGGTGAAPTEEPSGGDAPGPGDAEGGGPPDGAAGSSQGGSAAGSGGASVSGSGGGGAAEPPASVCGNGKLEDDEQCDDGGLEGEDGCSEGCEVVCEDFGEEAVMSADHHCYNGFDEADFEGSLEACEQLGGHLASISSAEENQIVGGFVRSSKWIGAFEDVPISSEGEGQYAWVTGEPIGYENWASEQPDQAASRCGGGPGSSNDWCYQHCVIMQGDGSWADSRCDIADGYVCEWEPAGG